MKYLTVLILVCLMCALSSAQSTAEQDSLYEATYKQRIQQSTIDGVHIPADMDEAYEQLSLLSDGEGLAKFKAAPEEVVTEKLKAGLQRWIYLNWGFEEGSRLGHVLKGMGLRHPEDMAAFVLRSYHRHLNQRPYDYNAQIEALNDARQAKWDAAYKRTEDVIDASSANSK